MRRLRFFQILRITAFTTAFLAAVVFAMVPRSVLPLYNLPAFLYLAVTVSWALTIARRIYLLKLRRSLLMISVLLSAMFVLQVCRDTYYAYDPVIRQVLWRAMFLPCVFVPVISCTALSNPEISGTAAPVKKRLPLLFASLLFGVLILTDPLHHQFFRSCDPQSFTFSPSWLFILMTVWITVFALLSLYLLVRRNRIRTAGRLWLLPSALMCAGLFLVLYYAVSCGPPVVGGIRLYHLPEAFSFLFIAFFESAIRTGLIPSNSGYEALFFLSGMGGAIRDEDGTLLFRSRKYQSGTEDPDHPLMTVPIRGGTFSWRADRTSINALNDEIREATEQIENENDLVEQERRVNEERMRYETQNRLYDRIAVAVRPRILKIEEYLDRCQQDPANMASYMRRISVLGTYVKRRGNLMLVADESKQASPEELMLALRESLDSLALSGIFTHLECSGTEPVSAPLLIAAYDLFEDIIDPLFLSLSAVTVELRADAGFSMTVRASADHDPVAGWKTEELTAAGAHLETGFEDETCWARLSVEKEAAS